MITKFRFSLLVAANSAGIMLASAAHADATVECNVGPGAASTECGVGAAAAGLDATAIGNAATASGAEATAVGEEAAALGESSVAVGIHANATGLQSVAIGNRATATNEDFSRVRRQGDRDRLPLHRDRRRVGCVRRWLAGIRVESECHWSTGCRGRQSGSGDRRGVNRDR